MTRCGRLVQNGVCIENLVEIMVPLIVHTMAMVGECSSPGWFVELMELFVVEVACFRTVHFGVLV